MPRPRVRGDADAELHDGDDASPSEAAANGHDGAAAVDPGLPFVDPAAAGARLGADQLDGVSPPASLRPQRPRP